RRIQVTAESVADTSAQLGTAASETGATVNQVTQAIQNVAAGAADSSRASSETTGAVAQLGSAIGGIARGAADQAAEVQAATETALQMTVGVERVACNARSVAEASVQTQAAAEDGRRAVDETISGMSRIEQGVGEAAGRVEELGKLGDRIGL